MDPDGGRKPDEQKATGGPSNVKVGGSSRDSGGVRAPTFDEMRRIKQESVDEESDGKSWMMSCTEPGTCCSFCKSMDKLGQKKNVTEAAWARFEEWTNASGLSSDFFPTQVQEVLAQFAKFYDACADALMTLASEAAKAHRGYQDINLDMVSRVSRELRDGFQSFPHSKPRAIEMARAEIEALNTAKPNFIDLKGRHEDLKEDGSDPSGASSNDPNRKDKKNDDGGGNNLRADEHDNGKDTRDKATRERQWKILLADQRGLTQDQLDTRMKGHLRPCPEISEKRAQELGDACAQFIRQFHDGWAMVEIPSVPESWSLACALHRAVCIHLGSKAPSLAAMSWMYENKWNRSGAMDKLKPADDDDDWVSTDRAMVFETMGRVRGLDRKLIVFGIYSNIQGPENHVFARYMHNEPTKEPIEDYVWIHETREQGTDQVKYMPIVDPYDVVTVEKRREINRMLGDETEIGVMAIIYLREALEKRGKKMTDIPKRRTTEWAKVLSSRDRSEWENLVDTYLDDMIVTKKNEQAAPVPEPDLQTPRPIPNNMSMSDDDTIGLTEEKARQPSFADPRELGKAKDHNMAEAQEHCEDPEGRGDTWGEKQMKSRDLSSNVKGTGDKTTAGAGTQRGVRDKGRPIPIPRNQRGSYSSAEFLRNDPDPDPSSIDKHKRRATPDFSQPQKKKSKRSGGMKYKAPSRGVPDEDEEFLERLESIRPMLSEYMKPGDTVVDGASRLLAAAGRLGLQNNPRSAAIGQSVLGSQAPSEPNGGEIRPDQDEENVGDAALDPNEENVGEEFSEWEGLSPPGGSDSNEGQD
ncbi:hypothetical protein DHEL01_v210016 [Diaporthe helianthi]|uniref:Uncharacterized protein n=1 Tax=Diaporthe helianthi TaxID=158607 RepID=A0A2P5HMY2_DIAHE|nr:hypothetical protein DHEL01_v210016 [Diaporthe helianthi]